MTKVQTKNFSPELSAFLVSECFYSRKDVNSKQNVAYVGNFYIFPFKASEEALKEVKSLNLTDLNPKTENVIAFCQSLGMTFVEVSKEVPKFEAIRLDGIMIGDPFDVERCFDPSINPTYKFELPDKTPLFMIDLHCEI